MSKHSVDQRQVAGRPAVVLGSDAEEGIEATFVPGAGMVCCSLCHRGAELLGQRGGLDRYARERRTMGVPFLHPYANRLSKDRFLTGGREVDLGMAPGHVTRDPNRLPIHGLLAAAQGWVVDQTSADSAGARLAARFDWPSDGELAAAFPFPHSVALEARLEDAVLSIETEVRASGDAAMPVSYGFHPYFRLPGVPRADWVIDLPVTEQVVLDELSIPTGEREPVRIEPGPLGERTFDDVYSGVPDEAVFTVGDGERRIEMEFSSGYPIAVVYAPAGDDVICFEPMTAPTNAMIDGAPELAFVEPGECHSARWTVTIGS